MLHVACTPPSEGRRGRHDSGSSDNNSELSISDSEEDSGGVSSGEGSPDRDVAAVMQQMDCELAQTEMGRSFERVKVREYDVMVTGSDVMVTGGDVMVTDGDIMSHMHTALRYGRDSCRSRGGRR